MFLLIPRSWFGKRYTGQHARDRFYSRYKVSLNRIEYEFLNILCWLNYFPKYTREGDTRTLFIGKYKTAKFYAIYDPIRQNIVTFLRKQMTKDWNIDHVDLLLKCEVSKVIWYDPQNNLSVIESDLKDKFRVFCHVKNRIVYQDSSLSGVEDFLEENYFVELDLVQ